MAPLSKDESLPVLIGLVAARAPVFGADTAAGIASSDEYIQQKAINSALRTSISAGDSFVFELCLNCGADVHEAGKDGVPPLHLAAQKSDAKKLDRLLERKAWIDRADKKEKRTAVHIAARNGDLASLKILVQRKANVALRSKLELNAADEAIVGGHLECLKYLLDKKVFLLSPIFLAVSHGRPEILKFLLERGERLTVHRPNGEMPIHDACYYGQLACLQILLNNGADAGACDKANETPLHKAAFRGHLECMKLVIDRHANVNARDEAGRTPAWVAASEGNFDCLKALLEAGANVNEKVNPDRPEDDGEYGEELHGRSILHQAVGEKHSKCVKLLIESDADVNLRDQYGATPAHTACIQGDFECFKILFEGGADMSAEDLDCCTPLDRCKAAAITQVDHGRAEIVRFLKMHGVVSRQKPDERCA